MRSESAMPRVLFIGGAGRSGSTLLDRLVGETDGFFSAGEVSRLWREGVRHGGRCGCGETTGSCPMWSEILGLAHAGSGLEPHDAAALQERIVRPLGAPSQTVARPLAFSRDLRAYLGLLDRLYHAIAEVSGARAIVDSSKEARHGLLLTRIEPIDLRIVQLVRDSRAVAYSWQRRKFDPGRGERMNRRGFVRTALEWNTINALVRLVGRMNGSFATVRYDDLVADPVKPLELVIRCAGVHSAAPAIDGEGRVELGTNHMVAGNPIRFERGTIQIRADEEWKLSMSTNTRRMVGALTWPALRRYGFRS
jgi:hypothetical protein